MSDNVCMGAAEGTVARMRGPVLMARENGETIPYYAVANNGPAPHEVWADIDPGTNYP